MHLVNYKLQEFFQSFVKNVGSVHVGSAHRGLCFWQVSSVSHYFEREVKHLEYVRQRKEIREQEKKEMELEIEKKKIVS